MRRVRRSGRPAVRVSGTLPAAERAALEGQSGALKWILVSCFGYQGFSNAKFGRIEVHEAINAHAREILLTAKERLEAGGWRVLHGIVDSVWVTPRAGADRTPLADLAADVSAEVGIDLEHEGAFEWVAFCPRRDGRAGALTRYFGRRRDPGDPFKIRGIECRQRSTTPWVASIQRDLPYVVVDDGARSTERVRLAGEVSPGTDYDAAFYRERAVRAAASVCSPLGWGVERVETYLGETRTVSMAAFGDRG